MEWEKCIGFGILDVLTNQAKEIWRWKYIGLMYKWNSTSSKNEAIAANMKLLKKLSWFQSKNKLKSEIMWSSWSSAIDLVPIFFVIGLPKLAEFIA